MLSALLNKTFFSFLPSLEFIIFFVSFSCCLYLDFECSLSSGDNCEIKFLFDQSSTRKNEAGNIFTYVLFLTWW